MADDQRVMYDGFSGKGPSDLLAPTTAAPWGATQLGAAFGWRNLGGGYRLDGQRDLDADSRGRDSRGVGGVRGAVGVIIQEG
jgi:hypothetical protein